MTDALKMAIEALDKCRAQFQFYADEHTSAGKLEKAATNQRFAAMAALALEQAGEPVADEDATDTFSRMHPSLELCVQFSDDGRHIRKWSRIPFEGGTDFYSHPAVPTCNDSLQVAAPVKERLTTEQAEALSKALCLLDTFAGDGIGHVFDNGQTIDADDTVIELAAAFGIEPEPGWWRIVAGEVAASPPARLGQEGGSLVRRLIEAADEERDHAQEQDIWHEELLREAAVFIAASQGMNDG